MAEEKAPYQLTVELDSSRPDALSKAIEQLRDIAAECDMTGKAKATIKFESYKQAELNEICDTFEEWLYRFAIGLGCQMKIARPGLRPEMQSVFRERYATPMDDAGWTAPAVSDETKDETEDEGEDNAVLITPPPRQRLALPAPRYELTVDDGTYTLEDADVSA